MHDEQNSFVCPEKAQLGKVTYSKKLFVVAEKNADDGRTSHSEQASLLSLLNEF